MRAVHFADYGSAEVLELVEGTLPHPGTGAVRIRVMAAGVNPADVKWRAGMFKGAVPVSLPHVPGYDVAGTIDALGESVEGLRIGDRVCAMLDPYRKGGYAEFAVIDAANVAKVPDRLSLDVAGALPTPSLTGIQLMAEHVCPDPGENVLITGAVGAVGRFAVHMALKLGARVIAAVRENQRDTALALGASEVLVLGGRCQPSTRFHHVADLVGGDEVRELCRLVPACGRIITVATTPINPVGLASPPKFIAVRPDGAELSSACQLVADGIVSVAPIKSMRLSAAAEAHRLLEAGHLREKIVLRPH